MADKVSRRVARRRYRAESFRQRRLRIGARREACVHSSDGADPNQITLGIAAAVSLCSCSMPREHCERSELESVVRGHSRRRKCECKFERVRRSIRCSVSGKLAAARVPHLADSVLPGAASDGKMNRLVRPNAPFCQTRSTRR
jgi:hypothetical protein